MFLNETTCKAIADAKNVSPHWPGFDCALNQTKPPVGIPTMQSKYTQVYLRGSFQEIPHNPSKDEVDYLYVCASSNVK